MYFKINILRLRKCKNLLFFEINVIKTILRTVIVQRLTVDEFDFHSGKRNHFNFLRSINKKAQSPKYKFYLLYLFVIAAAEDNLIFEDLGRITMTVDARTNRIHFQKKCTASAQSFCY